MSIARKPHDPSTAGAAPVDPPAVRVPPARSQVAFLRELHHRAAENSDLSSLLEFCAGRLAEIFEATGVAVLLTAGQDAHSRPLLVTFPRLEGPLTPLRDDPLLQAGLDDRSLVVEDWARWGPMRDSLLRDWTRGTVIIEPLQSPERPKRRLGLLMAALKAVPETPERDGWREAASDVALALGTALRFAAERESQRSRDEMRAYFNQIGAAMSSALNLSRLLRHIVTLCLRLTQADGGSLYLLENNRLRQQVVIGPDRGGETPAPKLRARESLLGWKTVGSALLPDLDGTARTLTDLDPMVPGAPVEMRSLLGIPLVVKDEVKGQLNLYTHRRRTFSPDEVALLTAFAGQAAMAIENAQVFESERQRAREATLLYRAARAIALCTGFDEVLDVSISQFLRVTEADRCLLFLAGDRALEFQVAGSAGLSSDQQEFFSVYRLRATQCSREVWDLLLRGRPVHLTGPPADCPAVARFFALLPANSCLLVPLLAKERMLGLIYLDDSSMARHFDGSQTRMVMTLSIQVATAIQRARLVAQLEENVDQLQALRQVAKAITGTLSLRKVLTLIVEQAVKLLGNAACALLVGTPGSGDLRLHECRGIPDLLADSALQNQMATGAVTRKRPTSLYLDDERSRLANEPSPENDPAPDSHDDTRLLDWLQAAGMGGVLAVPLIARRRIVGVLNCFTRPGRHFRTSEIRLMRSFANQAAAALENARLHDVVKNKVHELASLFEVGKAITSTLQLDKVLDGIAEQVLRVSSADACTIMLLDAVRKHLCLKTSKGLESTDSLRTIPLGSGVAGLAARTGHPMFLVDDAEGGKNGFPLALRAQGMRTALSVPLSARGRLIGLINIYHRSVRTQDSTQISLLTTLSTQAAIAIENASLYHEKHQVSQMLRDILLPVQQFDHPGFEVGHRFIPSSELSGDCYDMLPLGNHRAAFCMADVSGKGPRAAIYAVRARYILRSYLLAGYSPREVLTMLNQLITPETESGMFITLFCAEVDHRKQQVLYSSAGHEPPLLWRSSQRYCQQLVPRDVVVGVEPGWQYVEEKRRMNPDDLLVLYTDGVTEARGSHTEAFGTGRLQALVEEHAALPPQRLADHITASVQKHTGRRLNDDFSLMVVKMLS